MRTLTGLSAGIFWALDTVILGIALSETVFSQNAQAVFLAPFVSAFLHDFCSCVWMLFYTARKRQFGKVRHALSVKSGRFIILGALFGGPVGMTGYVFAIRYLGASYTAMVSAMFPALGAFLSWIFLKERLKKVQLAGFCLSVLGMVLLGYFVRGAEPENFVLGFACALLCVAGWAAEVMICAYGMKDPEVDNGQALMIRQAVSCLTCGIVILNAVRGWGFTCSVMGTKAFGIIALSAFFGTASYLCYYKTIRRMGPTKAMALNITYAVWAIPFSYLLLDTVPEPGNVLCSILILAGSLAAAAEWKEKVPKRLEKRSKRRTVRPLAKPPQKE